jgi:hypothetical protein
VTKKRQPIPPRPWLEQAWGFNRWCVCYNDDLSSGDMSKREAEALLKKEIAAWEDMVRKHLQETKS